MSTQSSLTLSTQELLQVKLPAWLRKTLSAEEASVISAEQLVGGHSNETWKIVCTYKKGQEPEDLVFVIRWGHPDGIQAPYDIPGQFNLLSALAKTSIPVPKPLWLEPDSDVIGAPFLVMEVVPGITPNRFLELDDPDRDQKLYSHVEMLARIHALDWRGFGIDKILLPPTAEECAGVALESVRSRAVQRGLSHEPWVVRGLSWLKERAPIRSEVGLLHGDPNLTNYRFENAEIVGVLDWDAARLSDPLWDVGAVSGSMWLFFADQSPMIQEAERERFLSLYHDKSGRSLGGLRFWETLFVLRASLLTYHPALNGRMSQILQHKLEQLTTADGPL